MVKWQRIRDRIAFFEQVVMPHDDAMKTLAEDVRQFEREAEYHTRRAVLEVFGEVAARRYQEDVVFHTQVQMLVKLVCGSIFGYGVLTMEERQERVEALESILSAEVVKDFDL